MYRFTKSQMLLVVACLSLFGCNGDNADQEAWRDYYQPEWATGAEALPTQVLATPPEAVEIDPELAPGPEGPVALEPVDDVPDMRENAPLIVQRGESLKLYAKWSGHSVDELMTMMELSSQRIHAGKQLAVSFSPSTWKRFQRSRQAFRQDKETAFFARNHVEDLVPYKVAKGDSVWKIAKRNGKIPLWVLEKFNSRIDLSKLRPGMELLIPKLVPLGEGKKAASQALWKKDKPRSTAAKKTTRQPIRPLNKRPAAQPVELEEGLDTEGIDESLSGMAVRVRAGETLRLYARWAGCLVREIRTANPGMGGRLQVGQSLFIPMAETRTTTFLRKRNDYTQRLQQAAESAESGAIQAEAAPIAVTKPKPKTKRYSVKRGDTAWKVANLHGLSLAELSNANPRKNLGRLRVGDVIRVPQQAR